MNFIFTIYWWWRSFCTFLTQNVHNNYTWICEVNYGRCICKPKWLFFNCVQDTNQTNSIIWVFTASISYSKKASKDSTETTENTKRQQDIARKCRIRFGYVFEFLRFPKSTIDHGNFSLIRLFDLNLIQLSCCRCG